MTGYRSSQPYVPVMALGALVAVAAPLSGARAEPPPLAGSPEAWLEGAERILRANTGRLLVLVSGNGRCR